MIITMLVVFLVFMAGRMSERRLQRTSWGLVFLIVFVAGLALAAQPHVTVCH
jgi:cytochrome c oxidase assembly factor CtaG